MAGCKVVLAVEFIEHARDIYRLNFPNTKVLDRDIRTIDPVEELKNIGVGVGELDILDGSPPCASFSTAGKGAALWGTKKEYSGKKQKTDDLPYVFCDWILALKPRCVVMENVVGLTIGKSSGHFRELLSKIRSFGYQVASRIIDASLLGVPQARRRVIILAMRSDMDRQPLFPSPFHTRTVTMREAFGGDDCVRPIEQESFFVNEYMKQKYGKLRQGETHALNFSLVRPNLDQPCPTITAQHSEVTAYSVTHPTQPRKFSLAELRRLFSFPDDFMVVGSYKLCAERFGRSVPPLMMKAIAESIKERLL